MASSPPYRRPGNVRMGELFILIFSAVGSGPAGTEGLVGSCGLTLAIIAIVVFPFFWSYVQALVAIELAVEYRKATGAVGAWSRSLFGRGASLNASAWVIGMQCSTAALVSEVSVSYFRAYWPHTLETYWQQVLLTLGIIAVSLVVNVSGVQNSAWVMWLFTFNALAAFGTLAAVSVPKLDARRFDNPFRSARQVNWGELVNLLIFNSSGYDATAAIAPRVANIRETMWLACALAGCSLSALYVACLTLPYLATRDDSAAWQSGHFVVAARELSGDWLALWVLVACVLTNVQVFISALMTASYTLAGVAEAGLAPRWLAPRPSGVPVDSIVACAALAAAFGFLPLLVNLSIQAIFYVFIMVVELGCFIRYARTSAVFPSLSGPVARRAVVAIPAALSMWVLVVQNRYVSFGIYTFAALFAAAVLRAEARPEPAGPSKAFAVVLG